MATPDQTTDAGEYELWVFVERVRCPRCESTELKTTRSIDQGDGSRKKTTLCQNCRHKFFVVLE